MKCTLIVSVCMLFAAIAQAQIVSAGKNAGAPVVSSFLVKDEFGKTIDIAAQKDKVVFINFWALSCVPCKEEMPTIDQLREHFKNDTDILVLPVDVDSDIPNSTGYMKRHHYGLHVYTVASVVPKTLFRGMLPTTAVIDKNGKIVFFHEGGSSYGSKDFFDLIEGLISK